MARIEAHPLPALGTLPDRQRVLAAIVALRRRGPVVALESVAPSVGHGGQTLIAGAPRELLSLGAGSGFPTPFHQLVASVDRFRREFGVADGPPVGAFGFLGHECGEPAATPRLAPFPDGWFLLTDTVIHWPEPGAPPLLHTSDATLARELLSELARSEVPSATVPKETVGETTAAPSDLTFAEFARAFSAARAALARGDSYQLCFTFPFLRAFRGDPLALYDRLRTVNPAPFAAFLEAPFGTIVSSSPERFLRVDPARRVEARPMKGTAVKPLAASARAAAGRALAASPKMRAENLMIADLLANDLRRVCRLGSVRATQPTRVEEHATLLQLVSVIEGTLRADASCADLLAAAFPPGSMTGAPKVRSIELLRSLESGPRGPYGGALGYLATDGRMDLSVVIRSALVAGEVARVNAGAGLVWDSEPGAEFRECCAKAAPVLRAIAEAGAA